MKSWIAPQLNNYIEGNYIDKDLKKMISLIDLGFKRFKRIISFFEIFLAFLKDIIHYKYKLFSHICSILI